jgi:hypothetical protein
MDERAAEQHFVALLAALRPGDPPPVLSKMAVVLAPKERQPERPVRPGVQGIL